VGEDQNGTEQLYPDDSVSGAATAGKPNEDWFLAELVSWANTFGFQAGVTLHVGGTIVSGTMISGAAYFALFRENISVALSASRADVKTPIDEMLSTYGSIYDKPEVTAHPGHYIHLRDAYFFDPAGNALPRGGALWRGKLSAVDGFSLGSLSTNSGNELEPA
jgi:hypothetical protein